MADATLSARAGEELMSLYERASGQLQTVKEKARLQGKILATGALTLGGGVIGGAANGYFAYDPSKVVFGLLPAEAGAVAATVVGLMNLAGKYSPQVRDLAFGMGAYALGFRAYSKALDYAGKKQEKQGQAQQVSAGAGYSAAAIAQMLEAQRARRAAGLGG